MSEFDTQQGKSKGAGSLIKEIPTPHNSHDPKTAHPQGVPPTVGRSRPRRTRMSDSENMTPVTLYVPMSSWREVEGRLTTDPQGNLLLVIEGRARTPVDKYDGHDLSLLHHRRSTSIRANLVLQHPPPRRKGSGPQTAKGIGRPRSKSRENPAPNRVLERGRACKLPRLSILQTSPRGSPSRFPQRPSTKAPPRARLGAPLAMPNSHKGQPLSSAGGA